MIHNNDLLPRDKHDQERVDKISTMDLSKQQELIPYLVEWIQDINWPISFSIIELLLNYPNETISHLKNVLRTNDGTWKHNCIHYYVRNLPNNYKEQFYKEFLNIINNSTMDDIDSEVVEVAEEILGEIVKNRIL